MKVLVTGGCGFIGSHVCEFYVKSGAEVIAYDNMTKYELARTGYATEATRVYNWNFLKGLGVNMMRADVRDLDQLTEAARGCDFFVHTAAQPAMTISVESPDFDFTTNVVGTFNVLSVARKFDIPVVYCSTIHVYGNKINEMLTEEENRFTRNPVGVDEQHPTMQGMITPLHASKMAAELYVRTFIETYKVRAAGFRLTGLYGPRQFGGEDHGWVANFAIRTVMGWPITIYGSAKQVRDILYATDVVAAFHAFYENPKPGIYNIGGGSRNSISLLECIKVLGEIVGREPVVKLGQARTGDLWYFVCEIEKAKRELGWQPKVLPGEGIENLVSWIQENTQLFADKD